MAKQQARTSARKVKDKWKAKGWFNLLAPEMFNRQVIGETPAEEPSKVMGRVTEVTVQDLTGDFSKMHIKLHFRVADVRGTEAHTQFVGHDMTSDYIRRLTRRKRTRTDAVFTVTTKDGCMYDGVIGNETPGAITLRGGEEDITLLRKNIAEIRASGISLMPEDLEKPMSKQDVAEVIAYLRGGLYP